MAVLANRHDLIGVFPLFTGYMRKWSANKGNDDGEEEDDARRTANAEHIQLSLVETHISQCQTGKQTR